MCLFCIVIEREHCTFIVFITVSIFGSFHKCLHVCLPCGRERAERQSRMHTAPKFSAATSEFPWDARALLQSIARSPSVLTDRKNSMK